MMIDLLSWAKQPSTNAGVLALTGALSGILTHALTPTQAITAAAVGVVGLIWPSNAAAQAEAKEIVGLAVQDGPTLVNDAEKLVQAYRLGLAHGAAVPAPANANPAPVVPAAPATGASA